MPHISLIFQMHVYVSKHAPFFQWAKSRKRSRKKSYSDSDSDQDIIVTSGRSANKKKKTDKDEQLEKIVNELKELHEQQYTPMQYRIWGEMIIGGLYSSKTEAPNTSMFSRAEGKEPKKKSNSTEVAEAFAKHISSAIAGVVPSGKHTSTSLVASPAKSIDNWSKCYRQLGDLSELRNSGVLTEEEYLHEKEAIMKTLKKLWRNTLVQYKVRFTQQFTTSYHCWSLILMLWWCYYHNKLQQHKLYYHSLLCIK